MLAVWLLALLTERRASSSGCPSSLKGALVRETARRESNVNDVAAGILAERFGVPYAPSGRRRKVLAGAAPCSCSACPHDAQGRDRRRRPRATSSHANDVILAALADGLGIPSEHERDERNQWLARTAPRTARAKDKVRVAIIGVGNCANSLLQGVEYYKDAVPGRHPSPASCTSTSAATTSRDIEFTAAFDVVEGQGRRGPRRRDLGAPERHDQVRRRAEDRRHGLPRHDPRRASASTSPRSSRRRPATTDDVVGILKETGTDVVVNYLPVGSEAATKWYAEQILEAGCAMVNCMPVFIAREPYWQKRFEEAGRARSSATTSSPRSARRSRTAC